MPEWAAPGWLAVALLVVPLVWWLHARRAAGPAVAVPALYLWRDAPPEQAPGGGGARRDPRWRLRALLAALLCAAAAGPFLPADDGARIELWLDDGPSMRAGEEGTPRALLAARAAAAALEAAGAAQATARRLRAPAVAVALDPGAADVRALEALLSAAGEGGPGHLPPTVALQPGTQHWLVTDGADPALAGWVAGAPLSQVIRAGEASENAAVLRLAVRPSAARSGSDLALLEVANLGLAPALRQVTLHGAGQILHTARLTLAPAGQPGDRVPLHVELPASARGALSARLSPPDALAADDVLSVDTHLLEPTAVAVSPDCGAPVRAVLAAHPGLREAAPAQLAVACGESPPEGGVPALWFRRGAGSRAVDAWPVWAPDAGELFAVSLEPGWLREVVAPAPEGDALLRAGGRVLVALREGPPARVEVRLDVTGSGLTGRREFPALVAGLADRLLERDLLAPVAGVSRAAGASRIAPRPLPPPPSVPAVAAPGSRDLTPWLLAVACVLLALDLQRSAGRRPAWPWRRRAAA